MGYFSFWHWIIVLIVIFILFGSRGKISAFFHDLGKGIKSFKKGLNDDDINNNDKK